MSGGGTLIDLLVQALRNRGIADSYGADRIADAVYRAIHTVHAPPPPPTPPLTYTLTPEQLTQLDDAQLVHEAMRRGYAISKIRERP